MSEPTGPYCGGEELDEGVARVAKGFARRLAKTKRHELGRWREVVSEDRSQPFPGKSASLVASCKKCTAFARVEASEAVCISGTAMLHPCPYNGPEPTARIGA